MSSFYTQWLSEHASLLNASSASLHYVGSDESLYLLAAFNLPLSTQEVIQMIPKGKGIAGQAYCTLEPYTTCNLSQDPNPLIQPQARHVQALSAIAYPLVDEHHSPRCIGVLGFGFMHPLPSKKSPQYQDLLEQLRQFNQSLLPSMLSLKPL